MHKIHHDSAFYPDPLQFDAWRFLRPFEQDEEGARKGPKSAPQPATAGGDSFLAFGYGKNICPGRFFAVNKMKLMLTRMLSNHGVQHMTERSAQQTVTENVVPFNTTTVKVRRRAKL